MFNLGYKEVVLNNLDGVTGDSTYKYIAGFGAVKIADINLADTVVPALEISTWVVPSLTDGDGLLVQIKVRALATDETHTVTFNASGLAAADIITGYDTYLRIYPDDDYFTLSGNLTVTMKEGYEGYGIASVSVSPVFISDSSLSAAKINLVGTITNPGAVGSTFGWQIEAGRKLGTFVNSYPYSQQHGGNSIGVDLEAVYKEYNVVSDEPINANWEGPEFVKHDYISADMPTRKFLYVIYVHEDFDFLG